LNISSKKKSFLQTSCKIKYLIGYRYDEENDVFYDVTTSSTNPLPLLKTNLEFILNEAANNMR